MAELPERLPRLAPLAPRPEHPRLGLEVRRGALVQRIAWLGAGAIMTGVAVGSVSAAAGVVLAMAGSLGVFSYFVAENASKCRACKKPRSPADAKAAVLVCKCGAAYPDADRSVVAAAIARYAASRGMDVVHALGIAGERRGVRFSVEHVDYPAERLYVDADARGANADALAKLRMRAAAIPGARLRVEKGVARIVLSTANVEPLVLDDAIDALTEACAITAAQGAYR